VPVEVTGLTFHAPVSVRKGQSGRCVLDVRDTGAVRITGDVVAPDGRVVRHDRPHADMTVVLAAEYPATERVPAPTGMAEPTRTFPGTGPLALSGPFAGLVTIRSGQSCLTAAFRPELGDWAERLAAFRLPVLLVQALVWSAWLARATGANGNGGGTVPSGVDSLRLCAAGNDVELLARHGDDIVITADAAGAVATGAGGEVLARLSGLRLTTPAPARREVAHAGLR
jgi:hypothetical protein